VQEKTWVDPIPVHVRRDKQCGIYCLTDTKTGQKYIRATTRINGRFLSHRWRIRTGRSHPWRKDILQEDIEIELLEATADLTARENFWIQKYRELGYSLVNKEKGRNTYSRYV
jgi:hypothetical protein